MTRTARMRAWLAVAADDLAGAAAADAFLPLAAFRRRDLGEVRAFQVGRAGGRGDGFLLYRGGRIDRRTRIGCGGQQEKRLGERQQGKQDNRQTDIHDGLLGVMRLHSLYMIGPGV